MDGATAVFEKTKERPLHEQVRNHLRRQYVQSPSDVSLPSLRQLSESLGVNHLTISRALRDLESEGVVRVVPGKGTFVAKAESASRALEMLTFHTTLPDLLETSRHTLSGMQSGLPANYSLSGNVLLVPPVPRADEFLQSLKTRAVAGLAIFGFGYLPYPDSFLEAQFIHEVAAQVPVVLVGKEHSLLKVDCIYCDPAPQMHTFLAECLDKGMRRFEYFGANDDQPHLKHRLAAFQEFLLARGLAWQHPAVDDDYIAEITRLLDARPEVVVAATPYRAHQLVVEAQQRGLQLGRDIHILCFAGSMDEVQAICSRVSVVLLEEEEVGRNVAARLCERLAGTGDPAPILKRVPGRLVRPAL